jgi:hypothetical protein
LNRPNLQPTDLTPFEIMIPFSFLQNVSDTSPPRGLSSGRGPGQRRARQEMKKKERKPAFLNFSKFLKRSQRIGRIPPERRKGLREERKNKGKKRLGACPFCGRGATETRVDVASPLPRPAPPKASQASQNPVNNLPAQPFRNRFSEGRSADHDEPFAAWGRGRGGG